MLLLPTDQYLAGAAIAVAATFFLLVALPGRLTARLGRTSLPVARISRTAARRIAIVTSSASFMILGLLVLAGHIGERDPLENPLPIAVWTLFWVVLTLFQAVFGNLWPALNPWTGPLAILRRLTGSSLGAMALLPLPRRIGSSIAILQFAWFAWSELISLAPSDPGELATKVVLYWLVNAAGMLVFGEREWADRAEPFSVYFRLVGGLSPLVSSKDPRDGALKIALAWPGTALAARPPLDRSGIVFLVLALGASTFDGLSRTFLWLGLNGINPLEFPGRSAVILSGTIGLAVTTVTLFVAFEAAVAFGCRLAGRTDLFRTASGRLAYSLTPIAIAFHGSHHLVGFLVDGQQALIAFSDPFALGWDLLGWRGAYATTSFLNTLSGTTALFNTQTAIIVAGHVVGIVMAHAIAGDIFGTGKTATRSQLMLAPMMVFYTAFGLWLLATPHI
ncbi:hypothetical protein [Hartmannibacter diazotrophicus]|uniref:hypothetical protein n=1 Tax=Hartmannibacter diazotrophicus TaxID=1482074 RepID=UPI0012FD7085|nr:hypothetical protein [Hartmannibacter diazotrophicus]